jgi:hypothetical protein
MGGEYMSTAIMNKIDKTSTTYPQRSIEGIDPDVLTNIYQKGINIVTWQRELSSDITLAVGDFLKHNKTKAAVIVVTPENTNAVLCDTFGDSFHFDRIPCRLVTTYHGVATEWLHHNVIDRSKLGSGNQGKSDEQSGLFKNLSDINRLTRGDVALLKGEHWHENEGVGLVHRSPQNVVNERRLLLTLDFLPD